MEGEIYLNKLLFKTKTGGDIEFRSPHHCFHRIKWWMCVNSLVIKRVCILTAHVLCVSVFRKPEAEVLEYRV